MTDTINEKVEAMQAVEISLKQAKAQVELGEALNRLLKNPDFKKVFTEHYCKEYALNMIQLRVRKNMDREQMDKELDSIALFQEYVSQMRQLAKFAKDKIAEDEQELELLSEELEA
jgi:hypothetical protein